MANVLANSCLFTDLEQHCHSLESNASPTPPLVVNEGNSKCVSIIQLPEVRSKWHGSCSVRHATEEDKLLYLITVHQTKLWVEGIHDVMVFKQKRLMETLNNVIRLGGTELSDWIFAVYISGSQLAHPWGPDFSSVSSLRSHSLIFSTSYFSFAMS